MSKDTEIEYNDRFFCLTFEPVAGSDYLNLYALDITERKKEEKKRMEVVKTKSDFVSMVSHELRTPLTAIKEGVAIVEDGSAGEINDEQREFLRIAKRNVDRLARLINNVLDFQKLSVGKMTFNITNNDYYICTIR